MKMSSKRNANVSYYSENSSDDNDDREYSIGDCDISSSSRANSSSNGSTNYNDNKQLPRKRGRGPSKRPCLNRNALMARENRQKKKEYLENIENKLTYYRNENIKLVNILKRQDINLKQLNAEVLYLKNVLKNNTSITALLNSMNSAIKQKSNKKRIDKSHQLNYINGNESMNKPEKNPMMIERMNHGNLSTNKMNYDKQGRDFYITQNNLDLFIESDHSYTAVEQNYDELFDFKGVNYDPCSNDEIITLENNIPTITSSSSNSCNIDGFNTEISEETIPLNDGENLFDNFQCDYLKSDEINLMDTTNDLFGNLNASGVCLHVNAGKISLEFCSICHLNSINSEDS